MEIVKRIREILECKDKERGTDMEDYRWIYMKFVDTIAAFATKTIEQNGVLSPQTLSDEIGKIIAKHPEIQRGIMGTWSYGTGRA